MRAIDSEKNIPIYLSDTCDLFAHAEDDGVLFHFTSITSLKYILRDMTLKMSDPRNFNDSADFTLNDVYLSDASNYSALQGVLNTCKVLYLGRCEIFCFSS